MEDETRTDQARLARSVITSALSEQLETSPGPHRVVIDLNPDYPWGLVDAERRVRQMLDDAVLRVGRISEQGHDRDNAESLGPYIVAVLERQVLYSVVARDLDSDDGNWSHRAIRRIWPDFEVLPLLDSSVATVKADAARASFAAFGTGITWAVLDSGVDGTHPHFERWKTLELAGQVEHKDFTGGGSPLTDEFGNGHGTPVAGVIGGEIVDYHRPLVARRTIRDGEKRLDPKHDLITQISGVAPRCKIVSYKVIGRGSPNTASNVMRALEDIQRVNDYGRNIRIHGVNLSIGYPFDPTDFACGHSPLCVEVDRLVRSGVVVVAAAGNSGFVRRGTARGAAAGVVATNIFGAQLTINDPGNAQSAITVGSTHRSAPHMYGVSYFSSKGPTGDGRQKPDLVAPGERILSCSTGRMLPDGADGRLRDWDYTEFSGTSMAAPHVSGAVAAFLSVRPEYIGRVAEIKSIFKRAAVDLGRVPDFQGMGLLDLMHALQIR